MRETQIIQTIQRLVGRHPKNLKMGIGDDCSVVTVRNKEILVTCDALVEGVHFRRRASWKKLGEKVAGAALSDIAAMGGRPQLGWTHLSIPKKMTGKEIQEFYQGLLRVFKKFHVTLAGGNTSRSPKSFQAVVMIQGERPKGVKMLRSNAKPGDFVYLAGRVGDSLFTPQIKLGAWLAKKKIANACIDVSDGLLKDLNHIALASKVKIVLHADQIPFVPPFKKALTYGEDYVLVFTVPPSKEKWVSHKRGLTKIGVIQKGNPGVTVLAANGKKIKFSRLGFEH